MECFRRAAKKRREIVELRREDARRGAGIEIHPPTASSPQKQGCICQISLRGSKFWLLKSTTVLMHRYIEIWKPTKSSLMLLVCSNL